MTCSTCTKNYSPVRSELFYVNLDSQELDTVIVFWVYFISIPISAARILNFFKEHTIHPFVNFNSNISIPGASTALFSVAIRGFSFVTLESFSRNQLASSSETDIVYNFKWFEANRPNSRFSSCSSFEISRKKFERSIDRLLSKSS